MSTVLGVFGFYYNPAACLIRDGNLIAFIEEEKLLRLKNPRDFFPVRGVKFCLGRAGITLEDVDIIAYPWDPGKYWFRMPWIGFVNTLKYNVMTSFPAVDLDNPGGGISNVLMVLQHLPFHLRHRIRTALRFESLLQKNPPIRFVPHHLSHAYSTFFSSGFDRAAILIIDGMGEDISTSLWTGEGRTIRGIRHFNFPNSLGEFYAAFTEFLGFRPYSDEGKLMGLAAYGKRNEGIYQKMKQVLTIRAGAYRVDPSYTIFGPHSYGERYTDRLVGLFGTPRERESEITEFHQELAFAAQDHLEEAAMSLLEPLLKQTGMKKLCIAGGVGMNCKLNGHILQSGLADEVFILPAANDAGSALGAAMKVSLDLADDPRFTMTHPYWGPDFTDETVEATLKEYKLNYSKPDDLAREAAEILAAEKIIGWFQGRCEVGARALGARSILASPLNREMLDKVNREVKHREPWRPFAPVLPEESGSEFYRTGAPSPFMILAFQVLEEKRHLIPAVVHVDDTCRPQTIRREENPLYYDLLKHFEALTGVPVLLNTSFNVRGEPIVHSPSDAVRCFFGTGMDYLAIGPFLVTKK